MRKKEELGDPKADCLSGAALGHREKNTKKT